MPGGYWYLAGADRDDGGLGDDSGPSVSGKPCPRFTAPVAAANADISAKMVGPSLSAETQLADGA